MHARDTNDDHKLRLEAPSRQLSLAICDPLISCVKAWAARAPCSPADAGACAGADVRTQKWAEHGPHDCTSCMRRNNHDNERSSNP